MSEARWQSISALLDVALEMDATDVPRYLDRVCGDDPALRAEVEALLRAEADAAAGDFLDSPAAALLAPNTAEDQETQIEERQEGPYRLLRQVGEGGMGVVYEALDTRLGRRVALKMLPPWVRDDKAQDRLLREARAAGSLDHPNICTLHDIGHTREGQLFLVMSFYRGETLAQQLLRGPMRVGEAIDLTQQVGEGLMRAHKAGIVHRDIKPTNIMITEEGVVKILDFGIAKIADSPSLTEDGTLTGTSLYMSPEQARGESVDEQTDVWALGALLYEMLAGTPAFRAETRDGIFHAVLHREPPPIERSDVAPALLATVNRALAKDSTSRYTSVADLLADLAEPSSTSEAAATAAMPKGQMRQGWRRIVGSVTLPVAALAVLGLLLAALGALSWLRSSKSLDRPDATRQAASAPELSPLDWDRQGAESLAAYWRSGEIERARAAYRRAIERDPERASSYAGLARALWRQYRADRDQAWLSQAAANAMRATELDEHLAEAWISLGLIQLAKGQTQEARTHFERIARLDPHNPDAQRGLGDAARLSGDVDAAEGFYRRALELRPSSMELHSILGGLYYRAARYASAETSFARALELAPNQSANHKNLAAALHMQDRYAEASRSLQQALSLDPEEETYTNLGTLYYFQGLYTQALSAFEKAVELSPGKHSVWGNLGDTHRRLPDHEDAATKAFRTAFTLIEDTLTEAREDPSLLALAAEYRAKHGDSAAALHLLDTFDRVSATTAADSETLFNATQAAEAAGDRSRAFEYLALTFAVGYSLKEIATEPDIAPLRQDRRYQELLSAHRIKSGRD